MPQAALVLLLLPPAQVKTPTLSIVPATGVVGVPSMLPTNETFGPSCWTVTEAAAFSLKTPLSWMAKVPV